MSGKMNPKEQTLMILLIRILSFHLKKEILLIPNIQTPRLAQFTL